VFACKVASSAAALSALARFRFSLHVYWAGRPARLLLRVLMLELGYVRVGVACTLNKYTYIGTSPTSAVDSRKQAHHRDRPFESWREDRQQFDLGSIPRRWRMVMG